MIELPCPHCGEEMLVEEQWAGKRVKCPYCGQKLPVTPARVPSVPSDAPTREVAAPPSLPGAAASHVAEAETVPPSPAPSAVPDPEAETVAPSGSAPTTHASPVAVPGYDILGELGRGGMGVVYKARQTRLGRVVALKMILSGAHAGSDDLARFRTEGEAIARLQHSNIVQIHEIGEHGGLPYFSLEFCAGGSLEKKLAGTPLPPKEAAALVETLARAMHAAHQKGVIHRDLKPANVLLAEDGTPKITDFGLAKKLDEAGQTATGAMMGTPSYMAPEQAGSKKGQVGPAADVYALGAILYECLTGRPPFKAATALDTILQVVSDEPVPPSQLQTKTPRDLECICLKCLHKEPRRRYASAQELAEDLRRFLDGKPIRSRPVGRVERAAKWVRRRPAVAALLAVSAVAVLGLIVLLDAARRKANERSLTEASLRREAEVAQNRLADEQVETRRQLDRTRRLLFIGQIVRAAPLVEYEPTRALALLRDQDACPTELRDFTWGYYHRLANLDRGTLTGHTGAIGALALSSDGRTLATAGPDGKGGNQVFLWDLATAKARGAAFACSGAEVASLAFSPSGQLLAIGVNRPAAVILYQVDDPGQRRSLAAPPPVVTALAFTSDGTLLTAAGQGVKVWDVISGMEHASWSGPPVADSPVWRPSASIVASFAADGRRVATAVPPSSIPKGEAPEKYPVRVFDVTARKLLLEVPGKFPTLALSPDGRWLVLGQVAGPASLWDLREPRSPSRSLSHMTLSDLPGGLSFLFSPDGRVLAGCGVGDANDPGGAMKKMVTFLWDLAEGRERAQIPGTGWPRAFTPDSKGVFFIQGTEVKLHDAQTGQLLRAYDHEGGGEVLSTVFAHYLAVTPDSRTLAVAVTSSAYLKPGGLVDVPRPGVVCLWDISSRVSTDNSFSVADSSPEGLLTPDGNEVVRVIENAASLRIEHWSVPEGKLVTKAPLGVLQPLHHPPILSPDYEHAVNQQLPSWLKLNGDRTAQPPIRILNTRTGREEASISIPGEGMALAFRADGRALAFRTITVDPTPPAGPNMRLPAMRESLTLLELPDGSPLGSVLLKSGPNSPIACAFSPDGREAAVAFIPSGEIGLADFKTGQYRTVASKSKGYLSPAMAWSRDGKRLAIADNAEVRVWTRAEQGRDSDPVRILRGHSKAVMAVAFSPDGATLASAGRDESVRLWDAVTGQERAVLPAPAGTGTIASLAFTPDGRELRALVPMANRVVRWLSDAPNASP